MGRRIAFLIIAQALMIGILISHVFRALSSLASDLEYSERYILAPAEALPEPIERVATMKAELELHHRMGEAPPIDLLERELDEIEHTLRRYRASWMAAESDTPDARRFRDELASVDKLALLEEEKSTVIQLEQGAAELRKLFHHLDDPEQRSRAIEQTREMKRAFRRLVRTNLEFIAVDHALQAARAQATRTTLVSIGIVSLLV
ncbi:MAG: hypothetical protein K0S65_3029, partial [Labilithrix sp.]|nr:hypothetical protein [Labilithrix sp.]